MKWKLFQLIPYLIWAQFTQLLGGLGQQILFFKQHILQFWNTKRELFTTLQYFIISYHLRLNPKEFDKCK